MIDVVYSKKLPAGTLRLMELLKQNICNGTFNPFSGTIYSQNGLVHNVQPEGITAEEIVAMDWLNDNIIGSIPTMEDLAEEAKPIVQVQGVAKAKLPDGESHA